MTRRIARIAAVLLLFTTLIRPAMAADVDQLRDGLAAMRAADWDRALQVSGPQGSVTRDIIAWHWLRAGQGNAADVTAFLDRRPDWPGLDWLRRKSEPAFTGQDPRQVVAFFDAAPPQTAEGALAHAAALQDLGREGEAETTILLAWLTMAMGSGLQQQFLEKYPRLIAPHHATRLDRMLWEGHLVSAKRMLPLVDDGHRALGQARIALLDLAPGVDTLIGKVPAALQSHPGLAHARFVWRDRKGRDAAAIDLMLDRSDTPLRLGEPDKWAQRRRNLARWEMRNGDADRAYRIAATHHLTPDNGYAFADLEWIAGYVALTKLNDPTTAAQHFARFDAAVARPISKGRGGYWLGRAYAAMGDADRAHAAYAKGAEHQTSFYGLLAAERIGRPFDPALANPPAPANWRQADFMSSTVLQAGLLLLSADELTLSERFLTHLVETLPPDQAAQLGAMAVELKQPHLAVMIAKRAARQGVVLADAYYPLHPLADEKLPMAPEMSLAIARRESEFDPVVVSGAGARGLMQVMPATAELVARQMGILGGHSTGRLTRDWQHNALLGANYLADLAGDFRGNVVMMSAGYNAGPRRPMSWMQTNGDPRTGQVDMIDWIEHIPFTETRNYVMRVTESLPIYRARLGEVALPIPFSHELTGSTLYAFAP